MEPELQRVDPEEGEVKRYRVTLGGVVIGHVVQQLDSITIRVPHRGRHLSRNGKRRPFWFPLALDRSIPGRSRQETRKDAVLCLLPRTIV